MPSSNIDVLIVGAGPTGLAFACELQRRGITYRIIDKNSHPSETSKALGLQPRLMELFHFMGIADQIIKTGGPIRGGNVHLGKDVFKVRIEELKPYFPPERYPYPMLVTISQSDTEKILEKHLNGLGGKVERNVEFLEFESNGLVNGSVNNNGNKEQIACKFLASCEGAHSKIRKEAGIVFEGKQYPVKLLLADVQMDLDRVHYFGDVWATPKGILALLPLGSGKYWRIIADIEKDKEGNVPEASLEVIQKIFTERTGLKAELKDPIWMSNFNISCRMVNKMNSGNVFLLGDAAHIHSPIGGQGITTGIADAYNLGWKMALVIKGYADIKLLNSFSDERIPAAKEVLSVTNASTSVVILPNIFIRYLRKWLIGTILKMKALVSYAIKRNGQLFQNYRKSSLAYNKVSILKRSLRAGDRAPNGGFTDIATNEKLTVFDALQTGKMILLVFTKEKTDLDTDSFINKDILAVHYIAVSERVCKTYKLLSGGMALLRPDGYIGLYSSKVDMDLLKMYLRERLFINV